jgi:hypothetical protein
MFPKFDILVAQIVFYTIFSWQIVIPAQAIDLPSDSDIPEEVLRAELILEGRSPVDGKALSATEFAELIVNTKQQIELENAMAATSNPKLKETLLLIRLRSFLKSVGIPIK